jgi:hypothetical protein
MAPSFCSLRQVQASGKRAVSFVSHTAPEQLITVTPLLYLNQEAEVITL